MLLPTAHGFNPLGIFKHFKIYLKLVITSTLLRATTTTNHCAKDYLRFKLLMSANRHVVGNIRQKNETDGAHEAQHHRIQGLPT